MAGTLSVLAPLIYKHLYPNSTGKKSTCQQIPQNPLVVYSSLKGREEGGGVLKKID